MARSDLVLALAQAGNAGDRKTARVVTEAIIAEERAKQHTVLADKLSKVMHLNGNGNLLVAPSSESSNRGRDFVIEVVPRRQLNDIILPAVTRRAVDRLVEEQQRADLLRAHGVEPRNRILLVGAPGTGKTTLAEAIAEAVSVSLFVVRYELMIGSYLGETATRMKRVFDYARTTPCVLFFDEFDAIAKERGDVHETGEIKRVVSSLLVQIDELPSYTIVAAATNHPELLDRATWRRFQLRLSLPRPTAKDLAQYVEAFLKRLGGKVPFTGATIAKRLGRISYAEAEEFCLALLRAKILAAGEKSLKAIIVDELNVWSEQARATAPSSERGDDAEALSSRVT
ncbi:MAG TPA: ATP-binding protein [Rhizobiaceae bacterium]|nr:ATP-binding protein [Rhizobiaceae bacterium]